LKINLIFLPFLLKFKNMLLLYYLIIFIIEYYFIKINSYFKNQFIIYGIKAYFKIILYLINYLKIIFF